MTNPSGTYAETHAARWLTDELGVKFERIAKHGNRDEGDLRAHELPWLCVELKNTKALSLPAWGKELAAEVVHSGASHGVVLWSPPGVGVKNIDRWIALEWGFSDLPCAVPLVVPLNRLHKQVEAMEKWCHARPTVVLVGTQWVSARWASSWLVDVRAEHIRQVHTDAPLRQAFGGAVHLSGFNT